MLATVDLGCFNGYSILNLVPKLASCVVTNTYHLYCLILLDVVFSIVKGNRVIHPDDTNCESHVSWSK